MNTQSIQIFVSALFLVSLFPEYRDYMVTSCIIVYSQDLYYITVVFGWAVIMYEVVV